MLLSDKYQVKGMNPDSKNKNAFKLQVRELRLRQIEQISLKDVVSRMKGSFRYDMFKSFINDFKKNQAYKDYGCDYGHKERVSLFAYYLANELCLSNLELKIVLASAFYYDLGNDGEILDGNYGKKSAERVSELDLGFKDEDMRLLTAILTCQTLRTANFERVLDKNGIDNIEQFKNLLNVLKDSIELDNVRLLDPKINPSKLKNKDSRELIVASYQLYENYKAINEEKDVESKGLE